VSSLVQDARAPATAAPASVLVVVTRRLGDVLLATPLLRSLKAAWPQAAIDVLVFAGTEGVLVGHPDVRRVVVVSERPGLFEHAAFIVRLIRRYDIAVSCLAGDRPTLYALLAGRPSVGLVMPGRGAGWKRWLLSRAVEFDDLGTHTVAMNLALADALGIARRHEIGIRWSDADAAHVMALIGGGDRPRPYAALHVHPKFNYKMWRADGWVGLARWLAERGIATVLTGGSDPAEIEFVARVAAQMPAGTTDLTGRMTFAQTACAIASARLFVGPDTVTTHMAAALGVPTIALYGPSNPVKWGPWPREFSGVSSPWLRAGTREVGNVELVQGVGACVPCMREGCDQQVASFSACLQELPLPTVIAAIERALARTTA
jgi:heptosyltransferase III